MVKTHCLGLLYDGSPCLRQTVDGTKWCIFHLPNKDEEHSPMFQAELSMEIAEQKQAHPSFLDFSGFHFPMFQCFEADFLDVYFTGAVFYESVLFWNREKRKGVSFQGDAWFNGVRFLDVVDFGGAWFRDAWFNDVVFMGLVDFSDCRFRNAWFEDAVFRGDARFVGSGFSLCANFSKACFLSDGDFCGVRFLGSAFFSLCRFQSAWFTGAWFKDVDFRLAVFHGEKDFSESNINCAYASGLG